MQLIVVALLAVLLFPAASLADDISLVKSNQWVNGTNTFVAENVGGYYWISGRVTSPFLSHTNLTELYVQDAGAGIRVLSKGTLFTLETNDTVFPLGVQVSVYGQIVQSNGLRMIRPERFNGNAYDTNDITQDFFISGTTTSPVTPEAISIATLLADGEGYEGKLVKLTNVYYSGTEAWIYNQNSQLVVTDQTGLLTFYIDRDTDIDGQLPPVGAFDLVGIAAQYSTNLVPSNGYEVIGRRYVDIIQSVGAEAPSLNVPTNATAVVGSALRLSVIGQDRNAADVLTLSTNAGPTNGTFTVLAAREATFSWTPTLDTLGTTTRVEFVVSDGSTTVTSTCAMVVRRASGGPGFAWINEFHYDNTGTDTNEGIELAGMAGIDLANYYVIVYTLSGAIYGSNSYSGSIDDEGQGYGAVWKGYPTDGLRNTKGGIALCHVTNGLLQFISYGGAFTATNGIAAGIAAVDVSVLEGSSTASGQSLQLAGTGTNYEDFTWSGPKTHTRGYLNDPDQTVVGAINADVLLSLVAVAPEKPATNQAFDVTCIVEPNYYAADLSVTAYYRINDGVTNSIVMGDEGNNFYKTVSQIAGQTNNTTVSYFVAASFTGTGTNSPRVTATNKVTIRSAPTGTVTALISEIDPNTTSNPDLDTFVEVVALAGNNLEECFLVHYNGEASDGELFRFTFPYFIVPDDGVTDTNGNPLGFCVLSLAGSAVANSDFVLPADLQNGPDGLVLYDRNSNILDAVAWEGAGDMATDDPGTVSISVSTFRPNYLHVVPDDNNDAASIQAPNNVVADTGAGWQVLTTTPGAINGAQTSGVIEVIYGGVSTNFLPSAIVLNPAGTNKSVIVSNLLSFTVSCTESDGDALTLYTNALPANAAFFATNGNGTAAGGFTFTPDATQTGVHAITFYAQDKDGTVDVTVQITVTPISGGGGECGVIISEYVEGSSNNKAIEIYNGTGSSIDLAASQYYIMNYYNGNAITNFAYALTGTVASGDSYVFVYSSAGATLLAMADQLGGLNFNGDDALVLRSGGTNGPVVDSLGQVGFDPGTEWGSGLTSTADNTIRRKSTVTTGDTVINDTFDPSVEWDGFAVDTFSGLGSHTMDCEPGPGGDTDADGMSDDYETTYFTNATAGVAGNDDDGDGFSNLEEYLADTIPNGPNGSNSLFEVLNFAVPGTRAVSFVASTGRVYTFQFNDNLLLDTWSNLVTDSAGTNATTTLADTNAAVTGRSYRVRVRVP